MKKPRFEIVGEWSGYARPAGQCIRECHREYTTNRKLADWCAQSHSIAFRDGTCLYLRVREMLKGERATRGNASYRDLIYKCFLHNVDSVDALSKAIDAQKAAACVKAFQPLAEIKS